jgi:hypothetical protein
MHFFALKGLKATDIHAKLELMYGPESVALRRQRSGGEAFNVGERICLTAPDSKGLC